MNTVRDAMVSNPGQLPADASAQAAGELFQRPEVRAVYVTEDEAYYKKSPDRHEGGTPNIAGAVALAATRPR